MKTSSSKRPENTLKTILSLLKYMGHYRGALFLTIGCVCISGLASIAGTYMLKPVINKFVLEKDVLGLMKMVAIIGLVYACGILACLIYNRMMVKISQRVVSKLREDLFEHVQKMPLNYFDTHTHGDIMSHFTNDMDTISEALNNSFTMIVQSFISSFGTILMLLILDWRLSLLVLFFLGMMLLYIRHNGRISKSYFSEQQKKLGEINGFVEEIVEGQKVEKVFNHEEVDYAHFLKINEELRKVSAKAVNKTTKTVPTIVALSYINYALSACMGGIFVIAGLTDIGTLASYLVFVRQSAMPMNQFTSQVNFLMVALASAEKIFSLLDVPEEIDEGIVTLEALEKRERREYIEEKQNKLDYVWKIPRENGKFKFVPLKGDVRFHDVVFGYNSEHMILKKINLLAKPGQKIAFVGSTGAGKTTIINLVNRFYEINEGRITYDGIDIRHIRKEDLRRSMAFIIQDTHLFTGTIADNIRYGRLEALDQDVVLAAKMANADSFIRRLPKGYETWLESDGANLSQGQRQLLAIARAAISKSPVLIMDEATSSIDTRTEKLIEKAMDRLMRQRTVFVIAHRLSTVRRSEAILVLEQGQVIERGNHESLLKQKGRYYELYTGKCQLQ